MGAMASLPSRNNSQKASGVSAPPGNRRPIPMMAMGSLSASASFDSSLRASSASLSGGRSEMRGVESVVMVSFTRLGSAATAQQVLDVAIGQAIHIRQERFQVLVLDDLSDRSGFLPEAQHLLRQMVHER